LLIFGDSMLEPTFIPQLQKFPLSLADVQFYVERNNRFIDPSNPTIEGTHIHECTELIVYVQGAMSFFVNGQLYDLQKGDIVVSKLFERGDEKEQNRLVTHIAVANIISFAHKGFVHIFHKKGFCVFSHFIPPKDLFSTLNMISQF